MELQELMRYCNAQKTTERSFLFIAGTIYDKISNKILHYIYTNILFTFLIQIQDILETN